MIDPQPGDEGKYVTYIPSAGPREAGIISSWNDKVVFVSYHTGDPAAATDRRDLQWGLVGNVRNRHSGHWEIHPDQEETGEC
jgi:hypothetical protein